MSTITLYASKLNQMPSLILMLKRSVGFYGEDLDEVRQLARSIDSDVCDLEDVISSLRSSSDTQTDKAAALDTIQADLEVFIEDTARIDSAAAEAIATAEEDFYDTYDYLRPQEDSFWDGVGEFFNDVGEFLSGPWEIVKNACLSFSQWCKDNELFVLAGCVALLGGLAVLGTLIVSAAPWLPGVLLLLKEGGSLLFDNVIAPLGTLIMNSPLGDYINDFACKFISEMGEIINTEWFGNIVEGFVTLFGPFIEVGKIWMKHHLPGSNFVAGLIGAEYDPDTGIYHIKQDSWQSWGPIGYNDGYDNVFRRGVGATGNTIGVYKQEFTLDGQTFIVWAWKGDYMNLGAGAETGIYQSTGDGFHYTTATEYACDMELILNYNGEQLFDYSPYGDEARWNNGAQWWVNGFDPSHQNINANHLDSTTIIDFNTMENGREMFYALEQSVGSDPSAQGGTWTFDDSNGHLTATLKW